MKRIGHITPSSNTALEPRTYAMNAGMSDRVTHHFARIPVDRLALDDGADAQFELERMLAVARLLAEAPLDAIVWNGTSASWRGLDKDLMLCNAITRETSLPATTSTIAFLETFRERSWHRIALAVPYTRDVTQGIEVEFAKRGFVVSGAAELGLASNLAIGAVGSDRIRALLREAAASKPDCIAVVCTNLDSAGLAMEMEAELDIPIVDSIAVSYLSGCRRAGLDVDIAGYGRLFAP